MAANPRLEYVHLFPTLAVSVAPLGWTLAGVAAPDDILCKRRLSTVVPDRVAGPLER